MPNISLVVEILVVICGVLLTHRWQTTRVKLPSTSSPPGPPAWWIIGNLFHIPTESAWITFTQWKKKYGPLVYLHGLGNSILVLNTQRAIMDLLDKRSSNYSHRPIFTVAGELMGLDNSMPIMSYGNTWRMHRKLAHVGLSSEAVKKYHNVQEDLAALMSHAFLKTPDDFIAQVRLRKGHYGGDVRTSADDKYITQAEETMAIIGRATIPGTYLVDLFPSLKRVPSWIPYSTFHRDGLKGRQMIEQLITDPFNHVRSEMASGTALPSLTKDLLEASSSSSEDELFEFEDRIKWVAGAMYGAGGESTYATVLTFILAMKMYPEVQRKAQAEIDRVIGLERLPGISDRPALLYVDAVVKETMRWHPALPLGIARRSRQDDVYEGYFIPAETIIIPNVWAIASEHDDPYDFKPERFLDENVVDPHSYAFGFGRRICPGKQLGDNNIFILIASILASFNMSPPANEKDDGCLPEPKFTSGLVSYSEHYRCCIKPRSPGKAMLVEARASLVKV